MGKNNLSFLEVIEWFSESGAELIHRVPEQGSGEIKLGAQLIVRESQAAVFFYGGKAFDAFGPGRHTLVTGNIPILTKVLSLPWGMTSPLQAEMYFTNMKVFPDLKWGTKDPVAFRDSKLGLVRLRVVGVFSMRVVQPVLLINSLVGTKGVYSTADIEGYLNRVIVSRISDCLGEKLDTLFNLPGQYDELVEGLKRRLQADFSHFGLGLGDLYITSITPTPEVQQAIDDKSRLEVFENLSALIRMKVAMSLERAAKNPVGAGQGMGLGLGFMMPALFAGALKQGLAAPPAEVYCPDCGLTVAADDRFCPHCGHQIIILSQCSGCGKNLPPKAGFCPRCGRKTSETPPGKVCPDCQTENLAEALYCNTCGVRL